MSVTTARDPGVPERKTRLHDAMEGLRFIRKQPVLLGAISLDLFAVLFGGAPALIPAIAKERLGVDAFGVGVLRSAIGIGAALMVIFLAVRPLRRKVGRTLFLVGRSVRRWEPSCSARRRASSSRSSRSRSCRRPTRSACSSEPRWFRWSPPEASAAG